MITLSLNVCRAIPRCPQLPMARHPSQSTRAGPVCSPSILRKMTTQNQSEIGRINTPVVTPNNAAKRNIKDGL